MKELIITFCIIMCLMALGTIATYAMRLFIEFICGLFIWAM